MTLNFDITLNPTQKDLLALIENNKYVVANISRQQGKSVLAKVLATMWLFERNKFISYVTVSLKLAKKMFKDITSVIPQNLLVTCNASDLTIETITGSTLQFYSSEQGDKIRGITNNYLIIDEVAFLKNDKDLWYGILQPTIKVKGEKVLFISTPNGVDSLFYDLALKAQNTRNWGYIKRTVFDDSYCPDIEELRNSTPKIIFDQEYMCEFIAGANSFFTGYHNCYDDTMKFNWDSSLWAGIDWSSTGKDETIITFVNKENQIKQFNIEGDLDSKYTQIATLLNEHSLKGVYAEDNSIGSVMINALKKKLRNKNVLKAFTTTNDSKTEIITELAILFEKGEITYNDLYLDRELRAFGYSVTKTKKLAFEGKGGVHDDRCMSLAIAMKAKKDLNNYSTYTFVGR